MPVAESATAAARAAEAGRPDTQAPGEPDTFPKLLIRNAAMRGGRPAVRHKDLGIWQTWTWSQVHDEVLAFSVGLSELGLKRGDNFAIIGRNKPRLYWAMCAGQALGAVPVPLYADSVAEEMAYVLEHAEVKIAIAEDQEQVDKIVSVKDRLTRLRHVVYDEPRGLRNYDHKRMTWINEDQRMGRHMMALDQGPRQHWHDEVE